MICKHQGCIIYNSGWFSIRLLVESHTHFHSSLKLENLSIAKRDRKELLSSPPCSTSPARAAAGAAAPFMLLQWADTWPIYLHKAS